MAHWAEIDENGIVLRVTVGSNDDPGEGYDWLIENLGGTWIQTSYNGNFRNKFAGIGDWYNADLDVFMSAKPVPDPDEGIVDWVLNEETYAWEPVEA
jgi:hypothetical protein